jgi:hypothetical protein
LINVGIDWAEAHHDVCMEDEEGNVLATDRVLDGIFGVERIDEMISASAADLARWRSGSSSTMGCSSDARVLAEVMQRRPAPAPEPRR